MKKILFILLLLPLYSYGQQTLPAPKQLQQAGANTNDVLKWDGSSWVPGAVSGGGIYGGNGTIPDGGSTVDVSGDDPLILNLDASASETNRMFRLLTDYSSDDAYTYFIQLVAPQDSLITYSFDNGIYMKYEGSGAGQDFTVSSNKSINIKADSTVYIGSTNKNYLSISDKQVSLMLVAAPTIDQNASGIRIELVANENQAFGDICYIDSDGEAHLADADTIITAKVKVMCIGTVTTGNTGTYIISGVARNDSWNWTVGGEIYLSTTGTTGNTLTQTAPSGTNDCVVYVGIATHADRILFNPSPIIIELN